MTYTEKTVICRKQATPPINTINKETHIPVPGKVKIESLQDFQKTILSEMKKTCVPFLKQLNKELFKPKTP